MSDSSKSIVKLLGEGKEEDKYYVYALCDPDTHVPFYIGKGEHFRVWAHEEGEEKERATILGAFQNHEITEDEKEERLKTLSVKHKTINAIRCRSGKQPEKVIIKWGLTSHEAFMAESALINLFQLMQQNSNSLSLDKLTNIDNGHASSREKGFLPRYPVMAKTVEQFENMMKQIDLSDTDQAKEFVVLVRINKLFAPDDTDEKIQTEVAGVWKFGNRIQEAIDNGYNIYALGIYNRVVKGVYQIKSTRSVPNLVELFDSKNAEGLGLNNNHKRVDPIEWDQYGIREEDRKRLRHLKAPNYELDAMDELRDPHKMETWKERKALMLIAAEASVTKKYINAYLVCSKNIGFLQNAQNPISYNFEVIRRKKGTTVEYSDWKAKKKKDSAQG